MTPTTFLKCFNKGERWKYAGKEVCLNWVWNSQPPGHEFDMLTTEPSWWGTRVLKFNVVSLYGKKSSVSSYISTFSALILSQSHLKSELFDKRLDFSLQWKWIIQLNFSTIQILISYRLNKQNLIHVDLSRFQFPLPFSKQLFLFQSSIMCWYANNSLLLSSKFSTFYF